MPHEVPEAQHSLVREDSRELTREEYDRLLSDARAQGQERLALLMEAICASGIRVSEVRYITMKAARQGRAEIALKGKIRTIFIPSRLCRKLLQYARKHKTASGEIFLTRSGQNLSRKQIWAEMKALCRRAGVRPSKVFPHNLRHLSARSLPGRGEIGGCTGPQQHRNHPHLSDHHRRGACQDAGSAAADSTKRTNFKICCIRKQSKRKHT